MYKEHIRANLQAARRHFETTRDVPSCKVLSLGMAFKYLDTARRWIEKQEKLEKELQK